MVYWRIERGRSTPRKEPGRNGYRTAEQLFNAQVAKYSILLRELCVLRVEQPEGIQQ